MKAIVFLSVGFMIGYLALRVLKDTVGFPAAWPLFLLIACGLVALSFYIERRSRH